jgi:hypothetical protein
MVETTKNKRGNEDEEEEFYTRAAGEEAQMSSWMKSTRGKQEK